MGPRSEDPSFKYSKQYCNNHLNGHVCVNQKRHGNMNFYYIEKQDKFEHVYTVVDEIELDCWLDNRWYMVMEDHQGQMNKDQTTMSRIT
jgi:hypothetical protein